MDKGSIRCVVLTIHSDRSVGVMLIGNCLVAVDLGATKIITGIFKYNKLEYLERYETPKREISQTIFNIILNAIKRVGCKEPIIGLATVGPIDYKRGSIIGAPNLGDYEVQLIKPLSKISKKIVIANDAVASLWAEAILGKARGHEDIVMIVMGTGIGGAAMVGGELVLGRRGWAHEFGHIVLDYNSGSDCGCGGKGHWEALSGGRWLPRTLRMLANQWTGPKTPAYYHVFDEKIDINMIMSNVDTDEFANHVLKVLSRITAAGLASLTAIFDPEIIFLGGGLVKALGQRFLRFVRVYLSDYTMNDRIPKIEESSFGELQALYGAYAIAIKTPASLQRLNMLYTVG